MTTPIETRSRRSLTLVMGMMAIGAIIVIGAAVLFNRSGQGEGLLPDLEAEPPGAPSFTVREWPEGSGDRRLLLRFDGVVDNVGEGPLLVDGDPRGSDRTGPPIAQVLLDEAGQVVERIVLSSGSADSAVQFENSDGHDHWHLMRVAEYSLWEQGEDRRAVAGSKIGFCLSDVQPIEGVDGPEPPGVYDASNECALAPDVDYVAMGISPGWADVYSFTIALQWIDVTDIAPGPYRLAGRADPDNLLRESNEDNELVFRPQTVVVPGYVPVAAEIEVRGTTAFRLAATAFEGMVDLTPENVGDLQNDVGLPTTEPRFRVVDGPDHGTIDVGVGEDFDLPDVTYTPDAGFVGSDSFTFVAIDPGFDDPRRLPIATVTLTVGG